jgi:hypothetical protein
MPVWTWVMVAGGAWALLLVFAWALCAAAGRGDGRREGRRPAEPAEPPTTSTVVADTGGIRAYLRAASEFIEAEQLTVTIDVGGTTAVLACSRSVVEVEPGPRPELTTPVWLGGREVATLRAVRRPGERAFDPADRLLLQALSARVAGSLQTADPRAPVRAQTTEPTANRVRVSWPAEWR